MKQVGRYQILDELGRGAMGIVYKALDPAIGRTIAIKAIRLSDLTDPEERQRVRDRLLREVQSAGLLSHPNIITIYDVLEKEDYAYIFMEYVNGSSLEQMLRKHALPEPPALLQFLRQVSGALDYAHRKGIVHRDIKPANIIISEGGPGGEALAKIADFGVAKFVSHEMTHAGTMIGTPSYMSPEQILGRGVDARSDQFSLAVMVYELLTGVKPFVAESLPALFYLISKDDPKAAQEVNVSLTEPIGKVLHRALAKDPNQRFASCGDFIGTLSIALGDCPEWMPVPRTAAVPGSTALEETSVGDQAEQNVAASAANLRRAGDTGPVLTRPSAAVKVGPPLLPPNGNVPEPAVTRRRYTAGEDHELEEPPERSSFLKRLGLILAMCFAIAAAIVFIVRWNSGPPIPVQDANPNSAPLTPPPSGDTALNQTPAPTPPPQTQPPQTQPLQNQSQTPSAPVKSLPEQINKPTPPSQPSTATAGSPNYSSNPAGGVSDVQLLSDPPGARIMVDDRQDMTCTAPCNLTLPNGRHTLTAELKSYNVARRIFSVPDENSLLVSLSKSMGALLVTSSPSGCMVLVDGKEYGLTPRTIRVPAGAHRIAVKNGSQEHEETVIIEADGFEARRFPCQ